MLLIHRRCLLCAAVLKCKLVIAKAMKPQLVIKKIVNKCIVVGKWKTNFFSALFKKPIFVIEKDQLGPSLWPA